MSRGVEDDDFATLQSRQNVLLEEAQFGREFGGNDFVLPDVDRNLSWERRRRRRRKRRRKRKSGEDGDLEGEKEGGRWAFEVEETGRDENKWRW